MRLAISNIAWDVHEDTEIAQLLNHFNVDAIDIAPAKYFPAKATGEEIESVRNWWAARGIEITGMQALLFGTAGLNVFGTAEVQEAMLQHLADVCRIGSTLGAKRLVFGSPKNRDRTGLTDREAIDIAVPFFRRLGDIAHSYGVWFCLEPNPVCYGTNFMMTSTETARIVREIAHPSIRMQLDIGAIAINKEDLRTVLDDCAELIGHLHASEPGLIPLGDAGVDHAAVADVLEQRLPGQLISIEMVATKEEPHIASVERALKTACLYYRHMESGTNA